MGDDIQPASPSPVATGLRRSDESKDDDKTGDPVTLCDHVSQLDKLEPEHAISDDVVLSDSRLFVLGTGMFTLWACNVSALNVSLSQKDIQTDCLPSRPEHSSRPPLCYR